MTRQSGQRPRPTKDAGKAANGTSNVSRQPVDVFAITARSPGADGKVCAPLQFRLPATHASPAAASHVVALPFELFDTPAQSTLAGPPSISWYQTGSSVGRSTGDAKNSNVDERSKTGSLQRVHGVTTCASSPS